MFFSILRFFRGYVRVRVSGYAPERFLNLCSNHGILMWKLVVTHLSDDIMGVGYEFNISIQAFRELRPYLHKTGSTIRVLERHGIPFFCHRYRKRKIYFFGIAVFSLGLFLLSQFIWNIEINGNRAVSDEMILNYLKEQGSSFGVPISSLDCNELEAELRIEFPDIIWTSAQISGTKLTITIKENLITEEANSMASTEACDIVADTQAVIYSMITRTGSPQVHKNDVVQKGDVLVSGRVDILDDAKQIVAYEYFHSDADIYGDVTANYQDSFDMNYKVKKYTGERVVTFGIAMADQLPLLFPRKVSYEHYNRTTERHPLHVCSDFYLPISFWRSVSEEYVIEQHTYSQAEAKALAEANFLNYLHKLTEKDIQIMEKNVMIDISKKKCSSTGTIVMRKRIGVDQPTPRLPVPTDERPIDNELE